MRKPLLICLLIISLILVSCGGSSRGGNTDVKLQKGTKGLSIEFLENGLPKDVIGTNNFFLSLILQNEGFHDIEEGLLILNLERDLMELEEWDLSNDLTQKYGDIVAFNLKGKSLINLNGEKQIARAVIKTRGINYSLEKIESRIGIIACYAYSTIFSETICIDTDPQGLNIVQKTCNVKDISSSGGQGAPVAITKVDQKIIPSRSKDNVGVQFTIFAKNVGKGIITDNRRYDEICLGQDVQKEDYNSITLSRFQFSGYEYAVGKDYEIECLPNPMEKTKEGYVTRCTLKDENSIPKSKLTFETQLVIELEYGYHDKLSGKIDVINKDS